MSASQLRRPQSSDPGHTTRGARTESCESGQSIGQLQLGLTWPPPALSASGFDMARSRRSIETAFLGQRLRLRGRVLQPRPSGAMLVLAEADLYFGRIRKTQSWHLLSYALDLMTAGVAVAKQTSPGGWVPMKFPQKISSMSRTRSIRDTR